MLEECCRANPGDVRATAAMAKLCHGPLKRPAQAEALQEDVFLKVRGRSPRVLACPHVISRLTLLTTPPQPPTLIKTEDGRGEWDPLTLHEMHVLADMYAAQAAKRPQAVVLFTECLQKRRQVLGAPHPATLATAHALARTHHAMGDHAAAEPLFEECAAGRRAALGCDHTDTVASVVGLATTKKATKQYGASAALYTEVVDRHRRVHGDSHHSTLRSTMALAGVLKQQQRPGEAAALLEDCVVRSEAALGERHDETLDAIGALAGAYAAQGHVARAEVLFTECHAKRGQVLGPGHPKTLCAAANLAHALDLAGKYPQAEVRPSPPFCPLLYTCTCALRTPALISPSPAPRPAAGDVSGRAAQTAGGAGRQRPTHAFRREQLRVVPRQAVWARRRGRSRLHAELTARETRPVGGYGMRRVDVDVAVADRVCVSCARHRDLELQIPGNM